MLCARLRSAFVGLRFTYTHTQKPCTHVAVHPHYSTPPPYPRHNPCPFQMTNVKMMVVITAWLAVVSGVYCETNKDVQNIPSTDFWLTIKSPPRMSFMQTSSKRGYVCFALHFSVIQVLGRSFPKHTSASQQTTLTSCCKRNCT